MTNATLEQTAPASLDFVGVDMAQQAFVWGLHGVRGTHSAGNDETGFQALLDGLKGRRIGLVVIEATGGLERALASFLLRHGVPAAVVNPRAAREFARSMGHLAKTDSIDALALAHYGHTLAAKANQAGVLFAPPSSEVQALQAMVARRVQWLGMRTAEKNRLGGDRLIAAGKPKKVALTACSHKLLRILNAMARTGQPWNDEIHAVKP